jgi:fructose 1,6-bisphosphate aldolase/phosphatase
MKVTISAIKADVGSIGGHTRPSERMLAEARRRVAAAIGELLIDGMVTYTGDDIALLMSHTHGAGAADVHRRCGSR